MPSEGIRRGSPNAFWNNVTVNAGDTSPYYQIGRGTNMFCFFVKSSGTATFQLQVAHAGYLAADGTLPDPDVAPYVWHDAWYLGTSGQGNSTPVYIGGTGAFQIASIVPDFEPTWIRLKRSDAGTAVTVTAGYEAWGD